MKNMYKNMRGFTVGSLLLIIALVGILVVGLVAVNVETVKGNEMGVKETWGDGVVSEPLSPKTYFLFPGWSQTVFPYDMGIQSYVMNDKDNGTEYAEGRKADAYLVQSKDQQDMRISLRVQWLRSPEHLIELHKNARDQVEERILRPVLLRVVKDEATLKTALDAYSGQGLVDLQKSILFQLQSSDELNRYIKVTDFVIEHIGLDPKYTEQIVARQVAVQAKLRADEETKQKLAEAEKAKAAAQSNYEQTLVEARRDKEKGILDAQKLAEQQILAAEADAKKVALTAEAEKRRNVLIAEGEKEAAINRAQAILALGQAEAEAKKLQLSAYAVPGADAFVRIEVSRSMSTAFQNIKGYLPEGMSINLLSDQYSKGVNLLVGGDTTVNTSTSTK